MTQRCTTQRYNDMIWVNAYSSHLVRSGRKEAWRLMRLGFRSLQIPSCHWNCCLPSLKDSRKSHLASCDYESILVSSSSLCSLLSERLDFQEQSIVFLRLHLLLVRHVYCRFSVLATEGSLFASAFILRISILPKMEQDCTHPAIHQGACLQAGKSNALQVSLRHRRAHR